MFIGGLALSLASDFTCEFASFSVNIGYHYPTEINFGLWRVYDNLSKYAGGSCRAYPEYVVDSDGYSLWEVNMNGYVNAARVFSVLTVLFAILSLAVTLWGPVHRGLMGCALYELTALFQGLVLLLLRSNLCRDTYDNPLLVSFIADNTDDSDDDMTCQVDKGALCAIFATGCWFALGWITLFAYHYIKDDEEDEKKEQDVEENISADAKNTRIDA